MKECSNWMNHEAIRKTVEEYESKFGAPDGSTKGNLSELNITRNCMECNMRPKFSGKTEAIFAIGEIFKDPIMSKLESVGMVRKCFKSLSSPSGKE